jgi:hypothetical protein
MCLLCQEEDLYFLYLEQMAREAKAARGETDPAQANWMWPSFAKTDASGEVTTAPAPTSAQKPAQTSAFVCDDPDSE